jgi:Flp pilus assembly protein TadG
MGPRMAAKASPGGADPRGGTPRGERGAVFFEFALVLPLLLSLVLGIFTGGLAYTNKISVVEGVREGARYGASLPMGSGATAVATWEAGVRDRVLNALGGDGAAVDICVKFVLPTGGTDCGLADPPGASNEPAVHLVKVSASRPASLEFFFFRTSTVLNGKLVARFERDTG